MMEGRSLCKECFFYEFMDKNCAKELKMQSKREKCNYFEPGTKITLYYEDFMSIGKDEKVPLYKEIA